MKQFYETISELIFSEHSVCNRASNSTSFSIQLQCWRAGCVHGRKKEILSLLQGTYTNWLIFQKTDRHSHIVKGSSCIGSVREELNWKAGHFGISERLFSKNAFGSGNNPEIILIALAQRLSSLLRLGDIRKCWPAVLSSHAVHITVCICLERRRFLGAVFTGAAWRVSPWAHDTCGWYLCPH